MRRPLLLAIALVALAALPAAGQQRPAPEGASGWAPKRLATAGRHMIVAAHPEAAAAGLAMLRAGGSAIDAAIAAQFVLNLVEPQSSGIGGGAFLLHHDAATGELSAWDGRETAPLRAAPDMFLGADGEPMKFRDAVVGGRAVGVPGVVALLAKTHAAYGRLPWENLVAPAIALAGKGFTVGPRLAGMLAGPRGEAVRAQPTTRDYFFPGGRPLAAGDIVRNPAFADTLQQIARHGRDGFYTGALAREIVATVQGHATNPGTLGEADLAGYEARRREPVCVAYRGHRVCGMGPPSSGGIAVGQTLGMLAGFDLARHDPQAFEPWHLVAEASKLAFADRNRYVADGDHVAVPVAGLLDPAYLAGRARLVDPTRALPVPAAFGTPPTAAGDERAPDRTDGRPGTSHISVIDGAGNAVALTTSIEGAFGAHLMVRGFLLNNQLTDFSFRPEIDGRPVANAAAPGKRPRSSMAPTIVYGPDGAVRLVAGSPGGSSIIGYVTKVLVGAIDWNLDPQAAIDLPHVVNRNGRTDIEERRDADELAGALEPLGHATRRRAMTSGLHVIERRGGILYGGADPRREGVALGD
jgi:gamma-glutamyltranspeptidase/glutathione hydrolase